MPGKDGFVLAVEARRMRPQLPFVFITGYSRERDVAVGPVLRKPFPIQQLAQTVARSLAKG
jgi:CheY-like chemotaxis protein